MDNKVGGLMNTGSFWMPESASTYSDRVDLMYDIITWGSAVIFFAIVLVMIYFGIKYRRTSDNVKASGQLTHHLGLELGWTIAPLFIVAAIFWYGFKDYLYIVVPPGNAYEIKVVAKQWMWQFEYPDENIKTLNELYVPVNRPIKLTMIADDVLHSFYVPSFRTKKDVVPNRYTTVWFEAVREGDFQIFCTEFCGDGHSDMMARLTVLSEDNFKEWLKKGSSTDDIPLLELGQQLYTKNACNTCHSIDGTVKVGPSWKGLYRKTQGMADGTELLSDENYIRESIVNPQAKIVSGYAPVMPSYAGLLSDREIDAIIEYIKSLK